MSLTINTNTSAISAAFNLSKNNDMLNKSLNRLSSGKAYHQSHLMMQGD
jgi:flagellin-like hook-associated protein FlgL